jgi:hypothetical protein
MARKFINLTLHNIAFSGLRVHTEHTTFMDVFVLQQRHVLLLQHLVTKRIVLFSL